MPLSELNSIVEYKNFIKSDNLTVLHFYAPWAEQCAQMKEVLEQMTKLDDYKNIKFANIVAEDYPEVSMECNITAVPTILLFKKEKVLGRIDGANPSAVTNQINEYLSNNAKNKLDSLQNRLQALIEKAPCMLFMKGNRTNPKCGFSKSIIELLENHEAEYETFDILLDNEVREGLKKYSNWPTYPQLYIRGELIGGLDIVREMSESGALDSMLIKKVDPLENRMKMLINKAPCMLFMKGNREAPRCGFSKAIIGILDKYNAKYETFDILTDNEVREGLKKFSSWPTYPQLYINGELIGGLDIVKELSDTGDLDVMLKKINE